MYGNHLYKQSILGSRKVVLHCAPFFSIIVPSLLTACKTGLKETYHFLPHLLRKQKQFEFHGSLREVTAGTQFCPGRLWMSNGETNVFFPVSSLLASGLSSGVETDCGAVAVPRHLGPTFTQSILFSWSQAWPRAPVPCRCSAQLASPPDLCPAPAFAQLVSAQ